MRMRTINWGEGPVKVGLYKGETICPKCQSVVGSDKNKLRGPGCTTCDPDQAIDSVAKYEVVDTDAVETEAVVRFFLTEAVDPVEPGDMDVVMDADEMTETEVNRMLVMDDEVTDPIDGIDGDQYHFTRTAEGAEKELRFDLIEEDEECDRQIEHHRFMRMLDPVESKDVYKSTRLPVALIQSAERALMKMAAEDFSHAA